MSEEHYGIQILKDGVWLYNGTPITRHNLVKLFASVLKRDDKGDYWLITSVERGRIEVEDAPFIAVEVKIDAPGQKQVLQFRTNIDEWVTLSTEHPLRVAEDQTGAPSPYILVRDRLEAKIARPVYYELAKMAVADPADKNILGVYSSNHFFPLGVRA